ncbi:flagellar brake protein [Rubrivivax albus]|uniref:Flagellar brake protein YcgR n=1 Tax=Rubrivivax albus TaxID=2499835 RepID=A0A437JQ65_9BURK|nr:flagellar brake protein [Rubrivivax albus]RVT49014.1 flagellar brake protein [Rubrivivax albus]
MFLDTQPAPLPAEGGRDAWQEFRVAHPGEILAYLRQLRDGAVPVQLSSPDAHALSVSLWSIDERAGNLSFSIDADRPQLPAMIESDELVGVAYLDSVKLQFDLERPLIVRGRSGAVLQTAWPQEMYRFQRRQSYRVRTLERHAPTAHLRHPAMPDMLLPLRVLDVSAGGCALFVGDDVPPLKPGTRLGAVRIDLDADTRFDTGLSLQHVTAIHPGQRGIRIGCEWTDLGPAAARALQRYIDQTQKHRRMLSLD